MTTKIAPTLRQAMIAGCDHPNCTDADRRAALAQFRAFLALEGAVRRWRCNHPGGLTEDEERIVAAHERLSRRSPRGRR